MRRIEAPPSLAQSVADQIRDEILSGRLPSGQRLVEARIADTLDVSRGPVREAFKLLCAEGLLEEEPRRGMYVVSLSADDVREIYDLRAALEGRAALLLAGSHRDADIQELHKRLSQLEAAAGRGDIRAVSKADLEFHDAVVRLSRNRRIHSVFTRHVPLLKTLIPLDEHLYRSMDEIAFEHRPMLEAIEAGDPELARDRFVAHVERARDLVAEYIETHPDYLVDG